MKKTYIAPVMEELDFKDTEVSCGVKTRKLQHTSGSVVLGQSICMNFTNWLGSSIFDDLDENIIEVDDEE